MGSIVLLMALIFYVFAVMATKLYGELSPERFGSLGASLFTLFQMMTLESWAEANVRPILEHQPLAWMFFVPFILIATFVVLNLFIGVIVDSIQTLRAQREAPAIEAARSEAHLDAQTVLTEIRALRAEVAALRQERAG
jgi:voltage-gated sodium channel